MELLGLLVPLEVQRRVLFDQLVERGGDLVLVALGLGLDRVGDRGLRDREGGQHDRMVLRRDRVARVRLLELGHRDDVAGPGLGHVDVLLALRKEEPGEALVHAPGRVPVVAVRLKMAGQDAQVRDPAGEGVGDGLEDLGDGVVLLVAEDHDGLSVLPGPLVLAAFRRGQERHAGVEDAERADPVGRGSAEDRKILRSTISRLSPGRMSWASSVPWAKNFSIRSSSPSATASTKASCSADARSARSAGIGPSARLPPSFKWASMRTRSTVPLKLFSSPTGICRGTTPRPNFFFSDSTDRSKEARSRSMRLMTKRTGLPNSAANFQTRSVWTSTPETASRTIKAASAVYTAERASGEKMPYPGASRKFRRVSRWMAWAQARLMEILRSISSPSKSVGQVPSSILPGRVVAPAAWRSEAIRVVFPTVLWPTTAMLRSSGAESGFMEPDYSERSAAR